MTPAPGAWTVLAGTRVKVAPVGLGSGAGSSAGAGAGSGAEGGADDVVLAPGEICAGRKDVLVGTATTPVVLNEVAPAGKSWMAAADWARGARLDQGAAFEGVDRG